MLKQCFCQTLFFLTAAVGLLLGHPSTAQTVVSTEPVNPTVEKVLTTASVNYLGFALQQERAAGETLTIMYGLGVHDSFYSTQSPPLFGSRFINQLDKYFGRNYSTQRLVPYAFAEARIYTTLGKRAIRGRNIRANCANYFALVGEVPFASGDLINVLNLELAYPVGIKYGTRLPIGSRLYVEGSIGAFLKISTAQQTLTPRIDLAFGLHY